ncbi:phosphatidylglycerol lysyltransferase domain-containing protein [Seohaeicola nanhaiensis]|uniref:Phosphatidylglycerol lysyltransferase domain-containing protein n=1 Tax=Seohaeicola nanhaiensis TaxID=1387282 RepID=A0ABV9KF75_9RHOB
MRAQISFSPSSALRVAVPAALTLLCFWLLARRLDPAAMGDSLRALGQTGPLNWLAALAATLVSFWAIGRYDAVAHRHLATGVLTRTARRSGACAIAFSQAVGFGLLTGSFARWRLLPGLRWRDAVRLTVFVAVSFLTALAALIGLVSLFDTPWPARPWLPVCGLLVLPLLLGLAFCLPVIRIGRFRLTLPTLPALAGIALWTVIDTAFAALALTVLIPETASLTWAAVFPAYLVALGSALISGTPGGLGPFELTLILLLPAGTEAQVIAGVIGFRLVYFALPALIAGAVLLRRPFGPAMAETAATATSLPANLLRAETAVIRQSGGQILCAGDAAVAAIRTPQLIAGIFDPISGPMPEVLNLLWVTARSANRIACLYKCGARSAALARRAGWKVQRIAREAVIDTARFDLSTPRHRQLRRKLRHAERGGLTITRDSAPPLAALTAIDTAWQADRGRARGTTMGRFCADYIQGQEIFVARLNGEARAFVTLHATSSEWCLDLMRWQPGLPDGVMHALITAAIRAAAAAGVPRLSLAAVPDHRLSRDSGSGLAQFKASFAPRWEPLYLAAPDAPALALAAADLARTIFWPGPAASPSPQAIHEDVEQNGFAMRPAP